jgi:hypothetical protein
MLNRIIFLLGLFLFSTPLFSQEVCYSVKNIENKTTIEGLNSKRYTFGIKQMTEEILSEKRRICQDGIPVTVTILSIESPSQGINIGPFMFKKKTTIVKILIKVENSATLEGEGESNLSVSSTFLELSDENLPFEQTVFSSAIKKALINALGKL